jgi:hypothetical protein
MFLDFLIGVLWRKAAGRRGYSVVLALAAPV